MLTLLLAMALASPPAVAPAPASGPGAALHYRGVRHRVLALSGDVRTWLPWSAHWRTVRANQLLRTNALVVVGEQASVTYENVTSDGRSDVISINTPLTFRVGAGEVRKIRLSPHFMNTLPELNKDDLDPDSDLPFSLKQAWQRDLVMLRPSAENQALLAKTGQANVDAHFTIEVGSDSLHIMAPKDKTVLVAQGFPFHVHVSWKASGRARPPYLVSVWREAEAPQVVAQTESEEHDIAVDRYGDYTVAVQSVENGKPGPPSLIHVSVMPSLEERQEARVDAEREGQKTDASVRALTILRLKDTMPPAGFVAVTGTLPYRLEMTWTEAQPLPPGDVYELQVLDAAGHRVGTGSELTPYFEADLPHYDHYIWRVRKLGPPKAGAKPGDERTVEQTSSWREVTVVESVKDGWAAAKSGVLYLGE